LGSGLSGERFVATFKRWLPLSRFLIPAAWALQRLPSQAPSELQAAAGGLRTLLLPAGQLGSLSSLAWSLSQHPRARFAVVVTSLDSGAPAADLAAMMSGGGQHVMVPAHDDSLAAEMLLANAQMWF
jgi:hypothetical protein